jgi:hypothetical protein
MQWNCEPFMDWHDAYLTQARSEHAVFRRLNDPKVEYCHRLHYRQMVAEKLAKAVLAPPGSRAPAPPKHAMFVRMLRSIRGRTDIARRMGVGMAQFARFLDSILPVAYRIERLSPDQAGFTSPNPEYPWQDPLGVVWAPATYPFQEFDPVDQRMRRTERIISDLLRIVV